MKKPNPVIGHAVADSEPVEWERDESGKLQVTGHMVEIRIGSSPEPQATPPHPELAVWRLPAERRGVRYCCAKAMPLVKQDCVCVVRVWCPVHGGPQCVGSHD